MATPTAQTAALLAAAAALFLLASAALPVVRSDAGGDGDVTAYDELRAPRVPAGACCRRTCRIVLPAGSYLASFSDRLTGRLDDRRISGLSGIRVRAFFRWWSITGIRADGDELVFEVGSVSAKFPARHFNASLECPAKADS
ncbi:hypothetical protein OsJ_02459 [Oryza sativa Japonica Group]|uniref:Uncharacterized protein n=1 Tax=Oryza sativa subsp. japonica TaxID=39947 RepID=A2ZV06_ORYSJ|nr:hypothetical protein OsJ_02459 [Oryza sativa Japonica Group]